MKHVEEIRGVNRRVIVLQHKAAGGDIVFMSVYGPTAESKMADKDAFYDTLTEELEKEKASLLYIGGDFNARLYEIMKGEEGVIGNYILERKNYVRDGSEKGISENTRNNRNRFVEFLEMHELREISLYIYIYI